MSVHLYLSLIPEALIASMLSPEEFGVYYAVGSEKKARGQAIFFELDPEFRSDYFRIQEGIDRCVPHEDGTLKSSIYISVYRVLEHVDLKAIKKLYLVTGDGRVLGLDPNSKIPSKTYGLHLYQEIAPVSPLVVSTCSPEEFYELIIKETETLLSLPVISFVELGLGDLATDPEYGGVGNLPYSNIDHLRDCLVEVSTKTIHTKMVDRIHAPTFPYRMVQSGLYIGNQDQLLFFPMPSQEKLRADHYHWWRSANM